MLHGCSCSLCGHGHQGRIRNHHYHEYESKVLALAFPALTGIKVTHDLIGEGDVVEKL